MTDHPSDDTPVQDPWARLRAATPARIGLGRNGAGLPTGALNTFRADAARARDAVHAPLDFDALAAGLPDLPVLRMASAAPDRPTYLRRPDLGRRLSDADRAALAPADPAPDLVFVVCDGLSSAAIATHAAPFLKIVTEQLSDLTLGPVVLVREGRVAIGDEIGGALGAGMVAVLIGERPGLTVADSMGLYLTYGPRTGRQDSERNCLSNIHTSGGQSYETAAAKLAWLVREARARGLTGTRLKEEAPALAAPDPAKGIGAPD
ncbi:ethanolamine ammonia-lyase subunit EutC [Pseudooceanicola sp. CBS1P-1]|uniref:Ethanolamine ammonia-lyase small subunit n=1 Tax=Pseudooceanicola albus TaxID=2692189 RepID=A0A6L7G1Q2_9RHOB|nr:MULTISPECIES: ethanolamine ammonia-lyase subunit EutC [Pseudooceanicola]MBT9383530.1 ethanolamine ammonia-lyase subunit EutC [Pseudooceanicola endophyticus]MXN17386.1 ethanolamine ammonia-lyase subunit EutC [Pseudooceanicola albus]